MAVQEVRSRYVGTLVGVVWFIINPLMMMFVFWFVFSVGFKVQPVGNIPFVVVFFCGLIPWTTFSETLMSSTTAITRNSNLVTKTIFPTEILPIVCLVASLISHGVMLVILVVLLLINHVSFSLYSFQFLYYLVALSIFSLGLSWFFSAVNVFYRDAGQILGVVLNMWFWFTPIAWGIEIMPEEYRYIIKLNPIYYIVEGYRCSFISHIPLWNSYELGIYFWTVCLLLFIIGGLVFRKLKLEFADVL